MLIGTSHMTAKGQVTIPLNIRKKFGLKKGDELLFIETEEGIILKTANEIKKMFFLSQKIAKDIGVTKEELLAVAEEEREYLWKEDHGTGGS